MWEWNLDEYATYAVLCNNCANILSTPHRVLRGGNWDVFASYLLSSRRDYYNPDYHGNGFGARCARTPF